MHLKTLRLYTSHACSQLLECQVRACAVLSCRAWMHNASKTQAQNHANPIASTFFKFLACFFFPGVIMPVSSYNKPVDYFSVYCSSLYTGTRGVTPIDFCCEVAVLQILQCLIKTDLRGGWFFSLVVTNNVSF